MRANFVITSLLLTIIVFFGLLSMHSNIYILFLIPISIVLAILIFSCIIYTFIFGLLFIIGWRLAESKLN